MQPDSRPCVLNLCAMLPGMRAQDSRRGSIFRQHNTELYVITIQMRKMKRLERRERIFQTSEWVASILALRAEVDFDSGDQE